jgi:hypothetical protein
MGGKACVSTRRQIGNHSTVPYMLSRAGSFICARITPTKKTFLSAFFSEGARYDVCGKEVSKALNMAAGILQYPITRGIPIEHIDTHSLWSGGVNALALSGYSDTQIQKMGRWKGATCKEYIQEELACYSAGMTKT